MFKPTGGSMVNLSKDIVEQKAVLSYKLRLLKGPTGFADLEKYKDGD